MGKKSLLDKKFTLRDVLKGFVLPVPFVYFLSILHGKNKSTKSHMRYEGQESLPHGY